MKLIWFYVVSEASRWILAYVRIPMFLYCLKPAENEVLSKYVTKKSETWTDVIVVQLASWAVNYSGRAACGVASATGAGTRWVRETS